MEFDTRIPQSRRPIAVEDDQKGDESFYSVSSPGHTGGIAFSDSEKAEALAVNLETQFQPVTDPSVPAVIEKIDVALRSYFMTPNSEPKLTNPEEFQESIRGLKGSKAPGPNVIPNGALKHLPQRTVFLLVFIFNGILLTHQFPTAWKQARVIYLNRGRIQHCPHPIGPLVFWIRVVNYLKRSH